MGTRQPSIRILMLPWLAHGHISPYLELAKKLTERSFFIYFCSTPINLSSIRNRLNGKYSASIQLVELHLPASSSELPPHYHTTNGLPTHLMATLKTAFEEASPAFSKILKTLKPDVVVYDFNQPWVPDAASLFNIPAVLFLTFGAAFSSFAIHLLETPNLQYPFREGIFLRDHERSHFQHLLDSAPNGVKDVDRFLDSIKNSHSAIWMKTSREIEGKYIDYLSWLVKKKIQPVGLLVQDPVKEDGDEEIMKWLEKKEESSVVFVSFGSEYFLSKQEMEEIAHGLEQSKTNFIWVVRFPAGEKIRAGEALPRGYRERVGERGMVVEGWAPQAKILGHKNIGGFVSHCGWNSVLESIKLGVPIIAMPMQLDQPLNARMVEEVGVGMEVKRDQIGRLGREEIARVIRMVVVEKMGMRYRGKASELSENISRREDKEIDEVVGELVQLCGNT